MQETLEETVTPRVFKGFDYQKRLYKKWNKNI